MLRQAARRLALVAAIVFLGTVSARADESCTVILDAATGAQIVRDGICDRRLPPQSSFKLPLALMGFDSGVLKDAHTPRREWRPGLGAGREVEKTAHDPESWLKVSVVWFSQELTRALGQDRFARYVAAFDYGNADVSGDPGQGNGLTRAWLSSSLQISADEQAAFIRKVVMRSLPISPRAFDLTAQIMPSFTAGGWKVRGKTGSGWLRDAAGKLDRSRPVGWFVGWAENGSRKIVFARSYLGSKPSKEYGGMIARDGLLAELPTRVK